MKLNSKTSDIFISIYIVLTLLSRIFIEMLLPSNYVVSIFIGLFLILILWVFVKIKFLNPAYFGLFNKVKNQ